ncbi:TPA: heterodisulfide reductase subunit B [Candidatus Poribacteria bacterium]|nr:heterodisulfide reductase subunit B [Candidatus Poribacteria bacterium]
MQFSYFPGCTLHSSAKEFDLSTKAVCEKLDIQMVELKNWNCCGATSAHSLSEKLAIGLAARNIILAEKAQARTPARALDLVMSCAACYNRTKVAQNAFFDNPGLRSEFMESFKIKSDEVSTQIEAKHLLEVFHEQEIMAQVHQKVKRPLEELKAVCYYGCLLVRPQKITGFDDAENPQFMDDLMKAIGVSVLDWPYKVECCGAGLSLTRRDIIAKLSGKLLSRAQQAGANCIIVACPLCHSNLDLRQKEIAERTGNEFNLPIFYFTELMGVAFDIPEAPEWLEKHTVDASSLLKL